MTTGKIEDGYRRHAALAQLHRWYLLYEEPRYGIDNALDALHPRVELASGLGEARGHDEYRARVAGLPAEWRNAHFPRNVGISVGEDGRIGLDAHVVYLNEGVLPDGAVRSADLFYRTVLEPGEGVLPVFRSIAITQESEGVAGAFASAYAANRTRSLVHYWLALIEDPRRDPEPVREILADGFALNFSSGTITDHEGFAAWLAGPGSTVRASTHVIHGYTVEAAGEDAYRVRMDLAWRGLTPDGALLGARTRHDWTVADDPAERFARIRRVDVAVIEPFAPVTDGE